MDIEDIISEWKEKGRLAERPRAEKREGAAEEAAMEMYVMTHHVLRLHIAGRTFDLPTEWFVPAYEGALAFFALLEGGADGAWVALSDGSFRAEWELRRTEEDLGVFSLRYPDFQRAEALVSVPDFIAEGKAAMEAFLSDGVIEEEGACYFRAYQAGPMTTADAWSAAAALAVWNDLRSAAYLFKEPKRTLTAEEFFGARGAELISRKMQGPPDVGYHRENPCRPAGELAAALYASGALVEEMPRDDLSGPIEAVTARVSIGIDETAETVFFRTLSGTERTVSFDPASDDLYRLLLWAHEIGAGKNVSVSFTGGARWTFRGDGERGLWQAGEEAPLPVGRPSFAAAVREELRRFLADDSLLREGVRTVQSDAGRILYSGHTEEEQDEARRHLLATLRAWNACRGADWLFWLSLPALAPRDFLSAAACLAAGL